MGNPKSFKIPINSPLANTLKSSISQKLLEFLGNYSDDVLAEYVTVLVCNGKHQNQAREDLEAFLGNRSEEFVSWLWDLLLDYVDQSKTSSVPLDPKAVYLSSPHEHGDDMDSRAERSRNLDNHVTRNGDGSPVILTTGEELRHPSIQASYTLPAGTEFSEGFQRSAGFAAPASDVNTEKIVKSKSINMPEELVSLKQSYPGRLWSSIGEISLPRQTSLANAYRRSFPPEVVISVSQQYDKPRISVWDRLGKPQENIFERRKSVDASHNSIKEQNGGGLHQSVLVLPLPSEGHCEGASQIGNGPKNSGQCKKLEGAVSGGGKLNGATSIRRKRDFGESSTGSGNSLVPLVGEGSMDLQYKETSGDPKRSKLVEEVSEATTIAQRMSDLKVRCHELEREICKLRSKHTGISRGGKPDLSSGSGHSSRWFSSGTLKHPGEDIEPRTIYVTNVHFAATKEALSNHFAKCGLVVDVVILTGEAIVQSKRSALITFASLESVNRALALSGTSFFSRTVKVFRKADMASGKSAPPQVAGTPVQARFSWIKRNTAIDRSLYPSSHLQWRRESVSNSSEPSAATNIQEKESAHNPSKPSASANIQEKESVSNPSESLATANIQEKGGTDSGGSQQVFQS